MDWNGNYRNFATRPNPPFSFLYNYETYSASMVRQTPTAETSHGLVPMMGKSEYGNQEKKKRLTSEQLDALERSFQEEVKLHPDRKMKLSQELGLQPRQIAIWFQNRRARWKAKQLESLYDSLKQEFDVISKEKQKLQEEVLNLKAMLSEQTGRKKISDGCTVISGEESVESRFDKVLCSGKPRVNQHEMEECSYLVNVDETVPYWGSMCSYPE